MGSTYSTPLEVAQLEGDEHAYLLVEQARLRCEQFRDSVGGDVGRVTLQQIHRELGMAGWLVSSTLEPTRRLQLLAAAHRAAITPMLHPKYAHALAAVVIEGEDAVVAVLVLDSSGDHMHLAHLHLLSAMELLRPLL